MRWDCLTLDSAKGSTTLDSQESIASQSTGHQSEIKHWLHQVLQHHLVLCSKTSSFASHQHRFIFSLIYIPYHHIWQPIDGLPNIPPRILLTCPTSKLPSSTQSSPALSHRKLLSIRELRCRESSITFCRNGIKHVITVQTQQPSSRLSRTGSNGNTLESNFEEYEVGLGRGYLLGLDFEDGGELFLFSFRESLESTLVGQEDEGLMSGHSRWQYEVISFLS